MRLQSVPWMAAFLAGCLAVAASVQAAQDEPPTEPPGEGLGVARREMAWDWRTTSEPGCLEGRCKGPLSAGQCGIADATCSAGQPDNPPDCDGAGCDRMLNCRPPLLSEPTFRVEPGAHGIFRVLMEIDVRAPWNAWARTENPPGTLSTFWSMSPTATACGDTHRGTCQYVASDHTRCSIVVAAGCNDVPVDFGTFSFRAEVCGEGCLCEQDPQRCPCWRRTEKNGLRFIVTRAMLGCPESS